MLEVGVERDEAPARERPEKIGEGGLGREGVDGSGIYREGEKVREARKEGVRKVTRSKYLFYDILS